MLMYNIQYTASIAPSWADAMFEYMQTLVSAGWQDIAHSNGSTVSNTAISNPYPYSRSNIWFTSSNDLTNTRSWVVLQQPPQITASGDSSVASPWGGTRQICIQRGTSSSLWRIKYSQSGAYTTPATPGTNQNTPVQNAGIADEVYLFGGGTDASPTYSTLFTGEEGSSVIICMADNGSVTGSFSGSSNFSSSIPNVHPYATFFGSYTTRTYYYNLETAMLMDPMRSGTFNSADIDPFVFYVDSETITDNKDYSKVLGTHHAPAYDTYSGITFDFSLKNGTNSPKTWFRKGLSSSQFAACGAMFFNYVNAATMTRISPLFMGSDDDGYYDCMPIMYARPSGESGIGGYKGMSGLLKWAPKQFSVGQGFKNIHNNDYIYFGTAILPWKGTRFK